MYEKVAWIVAGLFAGGAVLLSIRLIYSHLKHFTQPLIQSKIVGILWMVPIYAADSWISLRFKNISLYLDMCRDCYESYVIYLFLSLMIAYLGEGDEEKVVEIVSALPDLPHPMPFNWCNKPIRLNRQFLTKCKLATMQFVALKPLTTFAALVLQANGLYDQGHFQINRGYLYVTLIMNVSISYAFYYLVLFYLALGDHLAPFHPVPKFLCIKAVLFLSFWQSVFIAFLVRLNIIHDVGSWTKENVSTGIQNLLICVEMFLAAIAHQYAFPSESYKGGSSLRKSLLTDNLSLEDALKDFNQVMPVVVPTGFKPGPATIIERSNEPLLDDEKTDLGETEEVFDQDASRRGFFF